MTSIVESIQKHGGRILQSSSSGSLPLSQRDHNHLADHKPNQLRRRLSSLSLRFPPTSQYSSWALHRSKSLSSMGETAGNSLRMWWEWGWGWILSRKPAFAMDLELNEDEIKSIGAHSCGSWRHVFYKVRAEFRRIIGSDGAGTLPTTYRYDSKNYAKNFDDGGSVAVASARAPLLGRSAVAVH